MKKRTVITTEKREVWVISEGGVKREITDQQPDAPSDASESVTLPDQDDSDSAPADEQEKSK